VLTGTRAGKPFESVFETKLSEAAGDQLVPRVWASKKIGFLIDEIRLNGTNKELVDSVVDLGTKFGILTEYTSFLAAPEVDVSRSEEVRRLGLDEFEERSRVESGGQGVAQAANSKSLQRDAYASTKNAWLDHAGKMTEISTVMNTNGHTFFKRGDTWQPSTVKNDQKPDVELEMFSDEAFALLDRHPWLNRCLARAQDLTLPLEGKLVRFKNTN
jgi:Ca-activated chloride channel family protein